MLAAKKSFRNEILYLDVVRFIKDDTVKVDLVYHTLLLVNAILTLEALFLLSVH